MMHWRKSYEEDHLMTNRLKHYRRLFIRFLLCPINTSAEAEILKELGAVGESMSGLEKAEARLLVKQLGQMSEHDLRCEDAIPYTRL